MSDPTEGKSSDGFDDGKDMPDRVRKTSGQEVIVAHVKARRTRQRDRIWGYKIGRPECADVTRFCQMRRVKDKLFNGRL